MGTPDRLRELRAQLSPHLICALAHEENCGHPRSLAQLSLQANERFDELLRRARTWHVHHPEEDDELHLAHLMQVFDDGGIPALAALPVINEFVLASEYMLDE